MGRKRDQDVGELVVQEVGRGRGERDARRTRAEALVREIEDFKKTITRAFWDIGRRLCDVRDGKLHTVLGFDRFDTFVETRLGISNSAAGRLLMVASQLPRTTAMELGQEKAYALVAYSRAQPEREDPAELAAKDVEIAGKPLSQSTVRELLAAAKAARLPRPKSLAQRAAEAEIAKTLNVLKGLLREQGFGNPKLEMRGDDVAVVFTKTQVSRLVKS